jgi:nitrate reductase assembly molybdenum cofactor insertion protein NarJ
MDSPFNARLLAPLVTRPTADYHASIETARRAAAPAHPEAARHLGLFGDRLRDLAADELDELYRETFTLADQTALCDAAAVFLAAGPEGSAVAALPVFERLLPSLAEMRNPFTLLFKALCCLLIAGGTRRPVSAAFVHQSFLESE